jgi:hypothetical protein
MVTEKLVKRTRIGQNEQINVGLLLQISMYTASCLGTTLSAVREKLVVKKEALRYLKK